MKVVDTAPAILRAAGRFFSGTAISRVTGLLRDVVLASVFGTSPAIAAFWMAFRFANLLRRLLGEGAMQSAFIPYFEGLRHDDPKRGAKFFKDLTLSLSVLLIGIILLVEGGLWGCLAWADLLPNTSFVLVLSAVQFPAILFICLYALNASFLQCEHRYFLASLAPSAFNVALIIGVVGLANLSAYQGDMKVLSLLVVGAFIMEWMVTRPGVSKSLKETLQGSNKRKRTFFSSDVKGMVRPLLLGSLGVAAVQINSAVDTIFARYADLCGPAYLGYAIRIQQVPLAFIGVALAGALLPALSRAAKEEDFVKFKGFLETVTLRALSLMIPATFFLLAGGGAMVNLFFARGSFTAVSSLETTVCLWGYALGTVPASFVFFLAGAFYSRGKYGVPTRACLMSVIVNLALNFLFVSGLKMGAESVALATSISAFVNMGILLYALRRQMGRLFSRHAIDSFLYISLASLIAAVLTLPFSPELIRFFLDVPFAMPVDLISQTLYLVRSGAIFVVVLIFFAWLFDAKELLALVKISRPKK